MIEKTIQVDVVRFHSYLLSSFLSFSFPGDNEEGGVLSSWQHKNANWLKQVDIHSETTQAIKVTVMPFYLGCRVSLIVICSYSNYSFLFRKLKNLFCTG